MKMDMNMRKTMIQPKNMIYDKINSEILRLSGRKTKDRKEYYYFFNVVKWRIVDCYHIISLDNAIKFAAYNLYCK